MGARELVAELSRAGVALQVDGDCLVIRPASKLTDNMRAAVRAARPELLALLSEPAHPRPHKLTNELATRCHAEPWDDEACGRFVARVGRLLRLGFDATDADDLSERLHLRDIDGDDRACCIECTHYRPGRCGNHRAAGLHTSEVGRDLASLLQRCPGSNVDRQHLIEQEDCR
jgi:TubC N-terminal docking domain